MLTLGIIVDAFDVCIVPSAIHTAPAIFRARVGKCPPDDFRTSCDKIELTVSFCEKVFAGNIKNTVVKNRKDYNGIFLLSNIFMRPVRFYLPT